MVKKINQKVYNKCKTNKIMVFFLSKNNLKNFIIYTLAKEGPLTARDLFRRARIAGHKMSYQAVFKALFELCGENILVKQEKRYIINRKWIISLDHLVSLMRSRYLKEKETGSIIENATKQFIRKFGPKILSFIGNDKCCLITRSSKEIPIVANEYVCEKLLFYLKKHNVDTVYFGEDFSAYSKINIPKEIVENRKIIIISFASFLGRTANRIMKLLNKVKKKYNIKEIKKAVVYDFSGLGEADYILRKEFF